MPPFSLRPLLKLLVIERGLLQWCQLKAFSDLILNLDLGLILSFPLCPENKE